MKFSDDPNVRLKELNKLTEKEKQEILKFISKGVPIEPWPFGMPCSAMPYVIALGVSPGAKPRPEDINIKTHRARGCLPTINKPADFYYKDPKHYWPKVKKICSFLVNRKLKTQSEENALKLSAHLNLGTGQSGKAGKKAIESDILKWVSKLIYSKFKAKIVVGFGLTGLMKNPEINELWQNSEGIQIDWKKPDYSRIIKLNNKNYYFRLWLTEREDKEKIAILLWPNHPSRIPFSGNADNNKNLDRALKEADLFLTEHGF
ncbi:hypothetical protein KA977_10850 [Candidatus Dependentiae bacterium]|nr:hypothetical protein [Candidatus Dependentiae bacterium]